MTGILLEDANSNTKKVTYALKGDTVKIIKDCGAALIVEDKRGKRFPISKLKIQQNGIITTT